MGMFSVCVYMCVWCVKETEPQLSIKMSSHQCKDSYYKDYRKVSNIRRTPVGNKIVDHSDVVGA